MVKNLFMLISTCHEKIFEVKFVYSLPFYQLKFNIDSRKHRSPMGNKLLSYSMIYQLLRIILSSIPTKNLFDRVPLTMYALINDLRPLFVQP